MILVCMVVLPKQDEHTERQTLLQKQLPGFIQIQFEVNILILISEPGFNANEVMLSILLLILQHNTKYVKHF